MKPPTGGPRIGPIVAGIISQAMAETSSDFEQARIITSRPTGDIKAPPVPCSIRAATRKAKALGQAAQDGTKREQPDRGAEHRAGAITVRQLAAGRDEHGEGQKIGRQRDVHAQRSGPETMSHRRKGGGQHSSIELFHEHRAGHDQGGGAQAGTRRRRDAGQYSLGHSGRISTIRVQPQARRLHGGLPTREGAMPVSTAALRPGPHLPGPHRHAVHRAQPDSHAVTERPRPGGSDDSTEPKRPGRWPGSA